MACRFVHALIFALYQHHGLYTIDNRGQKGQTTLICPLARAQARARAHARECFNKQPLSHLSPPQGQSWEVAGLGASCWLNVDAGIAANVLAFICSVSVSDHHVCKGLSGSFGFVVGYGPPFPALPQEIPDAELSQSGKIGRRVLAARTRCRRRLFALHGNAGTRNASAAERADRSTAVIAPMDRAATRQRACPATSAACPSHDGPTDPSRSVPV
jgi:hypothetical protein